KAVTAAITVTDGSHSNGAGTSFTASAATPSKLAVLSVNAGSSPTAGVSFPVVVGAQDAFGNASAVGTDTAFALTRTTGNGTLAGTLTGTIAAGNSHVTVSGLTYTKAEAGVSLTVARTSGDNLIAGASSTFTVDAGSVAKFRITGSGT